MSSKQIIFFIFLMCIGEAMADTSTSLSFTATCKDGTYARLQKVKVENITKQWEEILLYPDTILHARYTHVHEVENNMFLLTQNIPNPFAGVTSVAFSLPVADNVVFSIYDLSGKLYFIKTCALLQGNYNIRLSLPLAGMFVFNVRSSIGSKSIKMLSASSSGCTNIEVQESSRPIHKQRTINSIEAGDVMKYTATCEIYGEKRYNTITDTFAGISQLYTFIVPKAYSVLDIYYGESGNPEGVVWQIADTIGYENEKPYGKHGKILSLDEGKKMMYSSFADFQYFAMAFDSSDGIFNTNQLMALRSNPSLRYPDRIQGAKWCRDKGSEWYLPAMLEVLDFRLMADAINNVLGNIPDAVLISRGETDSIYMTSTEYDNRDDFYEMTKRKAYYSNFSTTCDIGYKVNADSICDYYSSIKAEETWISVSVRACKQF